GAARDFHPFLVNEPPTSPPVAKASADDRHIGCPQPFGVLSNLEGDDLSLFQRAVTFGVDRGEVYEHIPLAVFPLDEPVPLLSVEPFDSALQNACPRPVILTPPRDSWLFARLKRL